MMRTALFLAVLAVFLGGVIVGCGGNDYTPGEGGEPVGMAGEIDDGVQNYNDNQSQCPVCGEMGLRPNFYAEVDGKRVYFDKKECMEKFKQNTSKYLK